MKMRVKECVCGEPNADTDSGGAAAAIVKSRWWDTCLLIRFSFSLRNIIKLQDCTVFLITLQVITEAEVLQALALPPTVVYKSLNRT